MPSWIQRYVMPGLVFESVVVGGGYATGRELVEFFLRHGPTGGLLGMAGTLVVWSVVLAVSFEFARMTGAYDYRTFFKKLLGPGWIAFEILYYAMLVLVLSVIGAACGSVFHDSFGLPRMAGTGVLLGAVGVCVYFGNAFVERALSLWALVIYCVYGTLVAWCLSHYGQKIAANLTAEHIGAGWVSGGVAYAGYNLAAIPGVLFCLRHMTRRREALIAGFVAGPIAILPGILLYLCVMAFYPAIEGQSVPSAYILQQVGSPAFVLVFQVVLFGTLVKTGVGLLHGLNERLASAYAERGVAMLPLTRPTVSIAVLLLSLFVANRIGIVALIARGYGSITYGFLAVFVLPVMTIGLWRILKSALGKTGARMSPSTPQVLPNG